MALRLTGEMLSPVRKVMPQQENASKKYMGSNPNASIYFFRIKSLLNRTCMIIDRFNHAETFNTIGIFEAKLI